MLVSLQDCGTLPSALALSSKGPNRTRQSLCRAPTRQRPLGKDLIGKGILCRVPRVRHSAKPRQRSAKADGSLPSAERQGARQRVFTFFGKFFAECRSGRHSAKIFFLKNSLPSATMEGTRQIFFEKFFAECHVAGNRQSWPGSAQLCRVPPLGKAGILFFFQFFVVFSLKEFRQHLSVVLSIHVLVRKVCIRRTTRRCCQNTDSDRSRTWKLTIYASTGYPKNIDNPKQIRPTNMHRHAYQRPYHF